MADAILTAEYLREVLFYNQDSGDFTWNVKLNQQGRIGAVAGHFCKRKGYALIYINGKRYRAHRLAWLYMTGEWPPLIDHKDRNTANNAWSNLRRATAVENQRNRAANHTSPSKVVGVVMCKAVKKWRATITLGYFDSLEDAINARVSAAKLIYGEFAPSN